jgi:outer membrane protein assembly factor BamB
MKKKSLIICIIFVLALALFPSAKTESMQNIGEADKTTFSRTVLWNSSTNDFAHSLTIVNNVACLSTKNGTVYALNAENADVLWSFYAYLGVSSSDIQTASPFAPSISVSDGVVYVGSINTVFALNASSGNMIWKSPTGHPIYATPLVVAGVVFIGASDNSVYAFNASNGIELWHCILGSSFWLIYSTPVFSNGVVYIGSGDFNVYAINATTGVKLWYYNTGLWVDGSLKVANGIVYVNNEAGSYFALNATNGNKLDIDGNIIAVIVSGTSAVVEQSEVFMGAQLYSSSLYSFNASDYARLWGVIESSPIVINGVVCIVGAAVNGDVLYALNVTNGEQLWTYGLWTDQNGGINLSSFAYADGVLYVLPFEEDLYAYNVSSVLPSSLDISILSPANERYNELSVPLVFLVGTGISWMAYSLDGRQNVMVSGNTTLTGLANGVHNVTVYANDTFGNMGSQTVVFTVEKPQTESFSFTVTVAFDVVPVVIACLVAGFLIYRRHRKTSNLNR